MKKGYFQACLAGLYKSYLSIYKKEGVRKMSLSMQVILEGDVLQSRKIAKNGKTIFFHRVLVKDGFGVAETVDIFSQKGERKSGVQKIPVSIGLDKDQKTGAVRGLRLMEV